MYDSNQPNRNSDSSDDSHLSEDFTVRRRSSDSGLLDRETIEEAMELAREAAAADSASQDEADPKRSHLPDHEEAVLRAGFFQRKYRIEKFVAWLMLLPFGTLALLLMGLVKLTSKGPALYRQPRIGQDGQEFEIVKLRTMYIDAEADGKAQWSSGDDDPRVTPVGRWLRKLHLDEITQLFNVISGHMTLIGPRPERPQICELLYRHVDGYYRRNRVKPGLTGLSQINLKPDENLGDVLRKQCLDLYYIENAGCWLDIRIFCATGLRLLGVGGERIMKCMGLCRRNVLDNYRLFEQADLECIDLSLLTVDDAVADIDREAENDTRGKAVKRRIVSGRVRLTGDKKIDEPVTVLDSDNLPFNAMTIDVEDYFQVSAFEHRVDRKDWEGMETRVQRNTDLMLDVLGDTGTRATFFVLGWVADKYPDLIQRIADAGHEIASHGYRHQLIYDLTPEQFATDLLESRRAISEACGVVPTTYRGPSFSITKRSKWALDVLTDVGFTVDSSIFPMRGHDRYGMPGARRDIHTIQTKNGPLIEFPPSVGRVGPISTPVGGGYFRLLPYQLTHRAIRQIRKSGRPAMFYIHPWEIDGDQPRIGNVGTKSRIRHYTRLDSTLRRWKRLLNDHNFAAVEDVLAAQQATTG